MEGNQQLADEIGRKHNVAEYRREGDRDFYAEVDREFPLLSWDERNRIANERIRASLNRSSKADQDSVQEYSRRFGMRQTKFIIIGVVVLVVCLSLPFGVLIWLKRIGKVS
jgi:hypothetical protein